MVENWFLWFYEIWKFSQGGDLVLVHTWSWVFRDMFLVLRSCNTRCSHSGIGLKWRHESFREQHVTPPPSVKKWTIPLNPHFGLDLERLNIPILWKEFIKWQGLKLLDQIPQIMTYVTIRKELFLAPPKPNHQKTKVMWATNSSYVHHLNASYNPSLHGSIISHHLKCPTLIALLDSQ